MKTDEKLDRNWLKGRLGDAIHAILCGAGHNIRLLLRWLRHFYAFLLWLLCGSGNQKTQSPFGILLSPLEKSICSGLTIYNLHTRHLEKSK